jgi:hypothetical protein
MLSQYSTNAECAHVHHWSQARLAENSFLQVQPDEQEEDAEGENQAEEGDGEAAQAARPRSPPLPMPEATDIVYRMNRAHGMSWDRRQTMYLTNGSTVCAGEARTGRYVRVSTPRHTLHLRKDLNVSSEETAVYALSVTYEDNLCVLVRRSAKEGTTVSLGFPDGLHVTLRCGAGLYVYGCEFENTCMVMIYVHICVAW